MMVPARRTETFCEIPIRPRHNSPEIVNIVNKLTADFELTLWLPVVPEAPFFNCSLEGRQLATGEKLCF